MLVIYKAKTKSKNFSVEVVEENSKKLDGLA